MNAALDALSAVLWSEACGALSWHAKGQAACAATLNRIWRKSPWVADASVLPTLTKSNISLTMENWDLPRMSALLHEKQRTGNVPKALDPPLLVVRWRATDYLIDGRTRINYWMRLGQEHVHRVIVMHADGAQ
jgi:hypothetical protein